MDSLTQLVAGAAVGEAVLGKKLGNKAVLWGAAAGTLQDLDVIPGMLLDTPDRLLFHRGFSHSLAFVIVAAPLLGWLFSRFYKRRNITFREWIFYFAAIFTVSMLIDAFTTYGTQLLWPLKYRFEFNNMFVVDPIFTLPLLVTTIWLMFKRRDARSRRILNRTGILISAIYLMFTLANKQIINGVFEQSIRVQGIAYKSMSTNPTPMNQLLWSAVVETEDAFLIGYYSHLDENKNISFEQIPKNHHLVKPFMKYEPVQKILRFTKGYYVVENQNDGLLINDLRFGKINNWETGDGTYVFQYLLTIENGRVRVDEVEKSFEGTGELFNQLWQRINGKKDFSKKET